MPRGYLEGQAKHALCLVQKGAGYPTSFFLYCMYMLCRYENHWVFSRWSLFFYQHARLSPAHAYSGVGVRNAHERAATARGGG